MTAKLSAVTRERLRRFMRVERMAAAIGAGVGAVYAGAMAAPDARSLLASLLVSVPIGVISAVLTASSIAGIEMFLLPRASMRWLDALPFAAVFILKTLVYGAIAWAVIAGQPGQRLLGVVTAYDVRTGLIAAFLSLVPVAVMVMMFQAAGLVGYRTFMALLTGKYRQPFPERRFFLFVDVVGSTAMAERLGALQAHRFLAAVFSAVAEPIELWRGEIYQYVGDEIVITWVEADGVVDARALRCFFAMRAAMAADANRFVQRFGVRPELRAALHLGEVIAGEVGQVRRAIVYHGDVMNTTGRLEQATREVGCLFIASAEALASLGPPPEIRTHDLGALALRGRVEPIHAFCVEESVKSVLKRAL
ncbi:adenylate/guanylate cyclase domain-containing protein [Variovorax sp. J31P207]|uniref:adenylate/guanylate cyclase domain-containing protein n=1 Tax=Variovorax sp. J31P207 TaxID=3053510 RepID=UPI0025752B4D|nr:adenylate/guanylate cyclase domain-containing protein [Variovorax sp. J31P207]MDM0071091.1 adenylate/guanylate cyclase domain-containing protein [Variovorax sp. J31P207]